MFSVSEEIYGILSPASRWLFVFLAVLLLVFAFSWLRTERKKRRERVRNLPGAGTVGELVVISGSDELPMNTWYPVPREGVLGSLRSCDLVVPCHGVRSQHLDFSWEDGTGLLIRPRPGCSALVDGMVVDRRTDTFTPAMIHGSFLQVGEAVLRLQLFSALDNTSRPPAAVRTPDDASAAQPLPPPGGMVPPYPGFPVSGPPAPVIPPVSPQVFPLPDDHPPAESACSPQAAGIPEAVPEPAPAPPRRRRADRWKEDWSE